MGRLAALLGWRGAAAAGLAVALALYYRFHESLPNTSTWGDVTVLSLLLMPAVFMLVYLALRLRRAQPLQLLLVAAAFGVLGLVADQAGLGALASFSKLAAMTAAAFWFLNYFETAFWVVLVALIIPVVDGYSVWRGPTSNIVEHHGDVFTSLSFAFPVPGENDAARLGLPDLLFFGLFLAASERFQLRVLPTWIALVASFGATIALAVAFDLAGLPALPLLSLGFLLPNADLLWRRWRSRGST
ncbi:MAG: hypothetical protein M3R70_06715 [Actinomycetota bacterium]|nr:hypothetical protein [Actinomycetota bacterium]